MKPTLLNSVLRSAWASRKDGLLQLMIVALLSALISGSLLTGYSVRKSLALSMDEKLGKTDIIISSGLRYFEPSLALRLSEKTGDDIASSLELEGFCQNFSSGATALNCTIYSVGDKFFQFNAADTIKLPKGSAAVNRTLADKIGIREGDEMIIHIRDNDPIPSNAPFSPSKDATKSIVVIVRRILSANESGNFSAGISQAMPLNVFINEAELSSGSDARTNANRLYIHNSKSLTVNKITQDLGEILDLKDIGLSLRKSVKRQECELISDRIFIDSSIVETVLRKIPSALPVLTYLANAIETGGRTTPYSFVSAIPGSMMPVSNADEIVISKWLAADIGAHSGDSVRLTWFAPGTNNTLIERSEKFTVEKIIVNNDPLMDPSFMPDFPGIAGSTTCSGWDAGIPVIMSRIRDKDEDYWNKYRGTPKAFISYKSGKKIWANNYGVATSIRFPASVTSDLISSSLKYAFDPLKTGFTITDARNSSQKAASESVDFGTLFLGLGIFIVTACLILLAVTQAGFLERKKSQVKTYFVLGFRNIHIRRVLLLESSSIGLAGAIAGVAIGSLLNIIIIAALNSVWQGAVQTNTLTSYIGIAPLLIGFISAFLISFLVSNIQLNKFLKKLSRPETGEVRVRSLNLNLIPATGLILISILLAVISLSSGKEQMILLYSAGVILFAGMILLLRSYYIAGKKRKSRGLSFSSQRFSSLHPGHATTPAIFIAAGLFAVIITAANKQNINEKDLIRSGGTGGYLFWAESAVPVKENLITAEGKKAFGLDEPGLSDMIITQCAFVRGDDASCLNLNHVTKPSLLAVDPSDFISRGSFSFASSLIFSGKINPWKLLEEPAGANSIYGIADQSVLEWGLKLKTGDTLKYRSENGAELNIIICAGLRSSVFQGYLLIDRKNLDKNFPSFPGNSVFLIDGLKNHIEFYRNTLTDRFSGYGLAVSDAGARLASFFTVSNTYLEVFTILGIFGMILGVAGLGFVLIMNFNRRRHEFALMIATGYSIRQVRWILLTDYSVILGWGIMSGVLPAFVSTLSSVSQRATFPFFQMIFLISAIIITGAIVLSISAGTIESKALVNELRKE